MSFCFSYIFSYRIADQQAAQENSADSAVKEGTTADAAAANAASTADAANGTAVTSVIPAMLEEEEEMQKKEPLYKWWLPQNGRALLGDDQNHQCAYFAYGSGNITKVGMSGVKVSSR